MPMTGPILPPHTREKHLNRVEIESRSSCLASDRFIHYAVASQARLQGFLSNRGWSNKKIWDKYINLALLSWPQGLMNLEAGQKPDSFSSRILAGLRLRTHLE